MCVCVCVCVRSRCVPLKPFTHVCADAVGWEEEYARLCGKLGLAPLLQPPPNPMAPAAAYYDEPTLDMAAWGKLGLRDGAMWQNMCSWAAHLARARSGRCQHAFAFRKRPAATHGVSSADVCELLWRAPMVGGRQVRAGALSCCWGGAIKRSVHFARTI